MSSRTASTAARASAPVPVMRTGVPGAAARIAMLMALVAVAGSLPGTASVTVAA
ncbi:hypothetical protein IE160_01425 [Chryseoglobus sp. 28M-23]|nr:hypothetical protein [Chryseoglobus sp. 28M-23]QOD94981.1 hypothetical protein IE160_01425 [Chryseoglobus sp. 28M-23]